MSLATRLSSVNPVVENTTCTAPSDERFRISNLPNPGNFGPESGSFIGLLSSKIYLATIRHCVMADAYFSM